MEHEHSHIKDRPDRRDNAACFRNVLLNTLQTGWIDPETLELTLTPDDILRLYRYHKEYAEDMYPDEGRGNFDLNDVYIITEDHLHMRHRWGRDCKAGSDDAVLNEQYIQQIESILDATGQAISVGNDQPLEMTP